MEQKYIVPLNLVVQIVYGGTIIRYLCRFNIKSKNYGQLRELSVSHFERVRTEPKAKEHKKACYCLSDSSLICVFTT